MTFVYDLDSGLPLAPGSTNADLAAALGLEPWQLNRLVFEHGRIPLEPEHAPYRLRADQALSIFGLSTIPEQKELADPIYLPLGFVALLLDMKAEVVERRLARLNSESYVRVAIRVVSDAFDGDFPGDGSRTLQDHEIQALAADAAPVIDLNGLIDEAAADPEAVYFRLAAQIERVRRQFENGERPKPECSVPTIDEVASVAPAQNLGEWHEDDEPVDEDGFPLNERVRPRSLPYDAMSPRELVMLVASGEGYESLLERWAADPAWAEVVEYACELNQKNGLHYNGSLRPPLPDRFHSDTYADENRWKWVVRVLRDGRTETLARVLWLDEDLAQLVLAHNNAPGIKILAGYADRFSPPIRDQLLDSALPLLLREPGRHDDRVAEQLVRQRGPELGLKFVELSLESGNDVLASGAARAWSGEEDALFWALREYPREAVRKSLSCLTGRGVEHGQTRLDPRVQGSARANFRERVVPVLLLDRSREVRRRARLAGLLARLPENVSVPFDLPPYRFLAAEADRWEAEGGEFSFSPRPEDEDLQALVQELGGAARDGESGVPASLVKAALAVVTDRRAHPYERDEAQRSLLDASTRDRKLGTLLVVTGLEEEDRELVLGVLETTDVGAPHLLAALERWPDDPAIQGAVIANREARKDASVQDILRESTNPHTLYALARARLGVDFSRRAFRALAAIDADRALRVLETASRGTTIPVEPDDWSRILQHPDRDIRLRAMVQLKGGPLRLV